MLYAKKRKSSLSTSSKTTSGAGTVVETPDQSLLSQQGNSLHRTLKSNSDIKHLVAADLQAKTEEAPLSASKCPMGRFT